MSFRKDTENVIIVPDERRTPSEISAFYRDILEDSRKFSQGEWIIKQIQDHVQLDKSYIDKIREVFRSEAPEMFSGSVGIIEAQVDQQLDNQKPNSVLSALSSVEKWADRTTGNKEKAVEFLKRVYVDRLTEPNLRAELKETDPALYNALAQHVHRRGVPDDLVGFFAEKGNRRRTANEAELDRLGVTVPSDVRRVVPDRREAERLYAAAKRRE